MAVADGSDPSRAWSACTSMAVPSTSSAPNLNFTIMRPRHTLGGPGALFSRYPLVLVTGSHVAGSHGAQAAQAAPADPGRPGSPIRSVSTIESGGAPP